VCVCVCVCVGEEQSAGTADLSNGRVMVLEHQAASRYFTSALVDSEQLHTGGPEGRPVTVRIHGRNRNGEERAGDEEADAEDKEWRNLLSWDGDVNKPGSSLRGGCVRE
jgi:hypothetical protein